MQKKIQHEDYTLDTQIEEVSGGTQNKDYFTVSVWKAAALVGVTVLTTMVGSAFAAIRILNSDHFALVTLGGKVDAIEESFVSKNDVLQLERRLDRIEIKLDRLIER